ncbi:DNA repair exonuclease [Candidatus Poribacteria bacterium]|nr:DNA repair exonuclease [Candidatus Poribacteria bacterium]
MVKFVHTSDWQMGMKARHVSENADRVREVRIRAAENVINSARSERAEFILIAGDVFEDNAMDNVLVQSVIDLLSKASCPVYIIPGNHDPLTPNSIYRRPIWERVGSNVHIITTQEPIEIGEVILYPCPLTEKSSREDPTAWIPVEEPNRIRIGVAHGTLMLGEHIEDDAFPIPPDSALQHKLDYLALGHWHSLLRHKTRDGAERTAYSGTHEQTKFSEPQSGQILYVEIEEPGTEPLLREIPTGILRWTQWRREVNSKKDIQNMMQELDKLDAPDSVLLDVVLEGTLDIGGFDFINEEFTPLLQSRFLYHRFNIEKLIPHPTEEELRQVARTGPLRETMDRLYVMANSEDDTNLPKDVTPEVAKWALSCLYRMIKEARG